MRTKRAEGETPQQTLARLGAAAPPIATHATVEPKASWRSRLWRADPARVAKAAFWLFAGGLVATYVFFPHSYLPGSTKTATTQGVVTDLDPAGDGMCFPHAAFVVDGERFTALAQWSSEPCPWTLGGPATIRYSPQDPSDAEVVQTSVLYRLLMALPIGLLLAALAALGLAVIHWCTPSWLWVRRRSAVLFRTLVGR